MAAPRIPKTIHYCWFSGEPFPRLVQKCIDSWRRMMPDYRLRLWDASSFDFASVPFVQDAIHLRKWAFAADYVRLYALHTEGGIYLDSDVQVFRPFDEFLHHGVFTSHEIHPYNRTADEAAKLDEHGRLFNKADHIRWINVQAAIIGGERAHPFFEACLRFYENKRLIDEAGNGQYADFVIGPHISKIAEQFGYRYEPSQQWLEDDMVIYPPQVFVGNSYFLQANSYALHLCNNTWHDRTGQKLVLHRLRNSFPALSPLIGFWEKVCRNIAKCVHPGASN